MLKISVLIPTYNRAWKAHIQIQVVEVLQIIATECGLELECIVSDNHSKPKVDIPSKYAHFVKLVMPPVWLPSGEENIRSALIHCTGDYIWILSDDDSPILESVRELFLVLLRERPDLIVCNSALKRLGGNICESQTRASEPKKVDTLKKFIQSTGVWSVITGFSGLVLKRDVFVTSVSIFDEYIEKSSIYSFAFVIMELFWEKKFVYFPQPIVMGTENDYGQSWDNHASKKGNFLRFNWTVGFTRLITQFEMKTKLDFNFWASCIDQSPDGRFHLLTSVGINLLQQLVDELNRKKTKSRKMTSEEFEEVRNFLCQRMPQLARYFDELEPEYWGNKEQIRKVKSSLSELKYLSDHYFLLFFIEEYANWRVFLIDGLYRAIPKAVSREEILETIRDIAPASSSIQQLIDTNLDNLRKTILLHQFDQRPEKDRYLSDLNWVYGEAKKVNGTILLRRKSRFFRKNLGKLFGWLLLRRGR